MNNFMDWLFDNLKSWELIIVNIILFLVLLLMATATGYLFSF